MPRPAGRPRPARPARTDPRQPHPRIAEAEQQGWLGEAEGLRVSRTAATEKLAQLDERTRRAATVFLNIPAFPDVASRTLSAPSAAIGSPG
jgi:hypothetical protein